jgi:hypothetical protein
MIVRISGEGQYRLPDSDTAKLNELESAVVSLVESGQEDGYSEAFAAVLDFIRSNGEVVADDDLETSSVIIPPSDLTFAEAGKEFTGEGLIPD